MHERCGSHFELKNKDLRVKPTEISQPVVVNSTQLRVNSAIPKASDLRTYAQHGSIVATDLPRRQ